MTTEEKVIPRDIWKKFVSEYWDEVLYKDLTTKDIKKYLGKFLFVELPKDVTKEETMKPWFDEMKGFVEKGKAFGGYQIDLSKDTTPLKDLFPKPVNPTEMNKILWDYIKAKKEKNTVVVHSIDELEKETAKIKSKGEKK